MTDYVVEAVVRGEPVSIGAFSEREHAARAVTGALRIYECGTTVRVVYNGRVIATLPDGVFEACNARADA